MELVMESVEDAFEKFQTDDAQMPPKSYLELPEYDGDYRAMPARIGEDAGIKWVNVHPSNPEEHGLPTVMGMVIYGSAVTGEPKAVMDGTVLTRFRTGAVSGIATNYLASDEATSVGLIGAGEQSHAQLESICSVRDIDRVVVSDVDPEAVDAFVSDETDRNIDIISGRAEEACSCDIISTTTPVEKPIIKEEWISPRTHINAVGADSHHKQELEASIISDAGVVVDEWEQCSHGGEISGAVNDGLLTKEDLFGTLSEVITDAVDVEGAKRETTVFDSTGLAIQDIATAKVAYERARKENLGETIDLVGK